jgi:hypothetical protein
MKINKQLGKRPRRLDPRTLQFRNYRIPNAVVVDGGTSASSLPVPPAEISYVVKVPSWPMLLNDQLSDCVIAAMGHMVQQWTFFSSAGSAMRVMTDAEALAAYEAIGGYNPNDPSTDQGASMLDALNYWRNTGIAVAGQNHQIAGYVEVDPTNLAEVREAIYLFGNLFTGLQMPISALNESDWTVPPGGVYGSAGLPGSWGGHCIPEMAESPETLTCITWGDRLKMSHNFHADYCDECYAVLSSDWLTSQPQSVSPAGFNMAALQRDIAAL